MAQQSSCRSCHAPVWWSVTERGKRAPFNADGTNHFTNCPQRREWRKTEPAPGQAEQPSLLDAPETQTTQYPR